MISVTCPICKQRMQGQTIKEWPDFPFCSRRCKTIDLGRWLGERYTIAKDGDAEPSAEEGEQETS